MTDGRGPVVATGWCCAAGTRCPRGAGQGRGGARPVVIDRLLSSSLRSCSPGPGDSGGVGAVSGGVGGVRCAQGWVGGGVELIGVQCSQRDVDDPAGEVGEDRGVGGDGLDHPGAGLAAPQDGGARHGEVALDPDGVHHLQGSAIGGNRDQGGGIVGISGIRDRQRHQHGHQPFTRLHPAQCPLPETRRDANPYPGTRRLPGRRLPSAPTTDHLRRRRRDSDSPASRQRC